MKTKNFKTKQVQPFLLVNDREKNVFIFPCLFCILFLKGVGILYKDRTFQFSAQILHECLVHCYKNKHDAKIFNEFLFSYFTSLSLIWP